MLTWLLVILFLYSVAVTIALFRRTVDDTNSEHLTRESLNHDHDTASTELDLSNEAELIRFREKADEAMRLTQTFQKFVPRQFVEHFAKHGSSSLELGRADEDDVAILFCDIRGFTGLSEQMKPQELMKFLNSYFLRMNDPIHQNGGFIDKFIGDAIMALFDHPEGSAADKANDSLNAAIDLHRALIMYNQHRANSGYSAIKIGIGIHYGAVIIGTVGSDDRMDTTVIGDSVNIANRLEALAPIYHADIVVSEQLLETATHHHVAYRILDWVKVKGRQAPLKIYEVLNHLPSEQRDAKLSIADALEKAIEARIKQDWQLALSLLREAQQSAPNDPLVEHHITVCEQYERSAMPHDWDGAFSP